MQIFLARYDFAILDRKERDSSFAVIALLTVTNSSRTDAEIISYSSNKIASPFILYNSRIG
jgi:hypothetical protein